MVGSFGVSFLGVLLVCPLVVLAWCGLGWVMGKAGSWQMGRDGVGMWWPRECGGPGPIEVTSEGRPAEIGSIYSDQPTLSGTGIDCQDPCRSYISRRVQVLGNLEANIVSRHGFKICTKFTRKCA